MNNNLGIFITSMPETRPAEYSLGCLAGSVFMDFDNHNGNCVRLIRISFDGYGCCILGDQAIPMNNVDSKTFKEAIEAQLCDRPQFTEIIKTTIMNNRKLIWEDALTEYGLV